MVASNTQNFKLLDCTLRDGGYVNNFNFKANNINKIIQGLSLSNIDAIELGFLKNGNHSSDQSLFNYVSEAEKFLQNVDTSQEFCLMIRPDWYDISKLEPCTGKVKTLRFAFHYEDLSLMLQQAEIAKKFGYSVIFNPVNINSYTESELKSLLTTLNFYKPKAIYIVDTFGSLLPDNLRSIFTVFDSCLDKDIAIGLHLHENLSISLALACMFIDLVGKTRVGYIDSSVLGIGRIPGNLCTELIMNFFNKCQNSNYNVEEIYKLIDNPITEIKNVTPWGYSPVYAITAFKKIHRSYAEFLTEKTDLGLEDMNIILSQINDIKDQENYNQNLIEDLYSNFKSGNK